MSSNITVVHDANVMYPAPLRSFLMYLAVSGEFRARWTELIHDEWIGNLLKNRPDLTIDQLSRVRSLMNENVPGSLVTGFEGLIESIDLPNQALSKYGIVALHPDEFVSSLIDLNAGIVIEAARRQRCSLKNPSLTASAFFDLLQKQQLPKTVAYLRKFEFMI
jgi:hypothetical protein